MTVRVLFLPHGRRRAYFDGLLADAVARRAWRIAVVAPAASRAAYAGYVHRAEDHLALPNFLADAAAGVGSDAATAAAIAAAERTSGVPVARLVLAGEREFGRGFARPFVYFPERRVAAHSLDDNAMPERIVAAMFARAGEMLDAFRPDVVVSGNLAAPHHMALALVAQQRGTPVLVGRASKIHSDRSYWTTDLFMLNAAAATEAAARNAAGASPDPEAVAYLAAFRSRPRTVAYIARFWSASSAHSWIARHRHFAELAALQIIHRLRRRAGAPPRPVWPSVVDHYRTKWLTWRQSGFFSRPAPDELARLRFVYLPFHKEPELAINFQAPAWRNQYETAAKLAASLPYGTRLVVRDHRFNQGRRPTRFYAELAALPGVILADPYDDQFKYITTATVIVTDNGSTGWEGLILGRPVVTLDRTFYDAAGLAHPVYEPARLGEVLVRLMHNAPEPPADAEARLANLVAAEFATTVADEGEVGRAASIAAIEAAAAAAARQREAAQ